MRSVENSDEVRETFSTQNTELESDNSSNPYNDSIQGQNTDPAIEKSIGTGVSELRDSVLSCSDTLKNDINKSSVCNASIIDYYGRVLDSVGLLASIKRFRGTVVPGGDTVHFKIPVYGNISLENIEFSGLVFKDPEIIVETDDFENPYSFASGFWTVFSSAGGLVTLGFATEPILDASTDKMNAIMLLSCGYILTGVGQYFGVDKLIRHFRWNHQFGNKLSLHN
jgi:hypothetical protein